MNTQTPRLIDDPNWRHRGNPDYSEHNSLGFRPSVSLDLSTTLVTGSSHVYGTNLQPGCSWPSVLVNKGRLLSDVSMGAWSAMQFAMVAKSYLRPNHKLFLLPIYVGFDIYATLKHSRDTNSAFAKEMMRDLEEVPQLSWTNRNKRDTFIKEKMASGSNILDILRLAQDAGLPDTFSFASEYGELWLEPELRASTMNLDHPYIYSATILLLRYIAFIREICKNNGTRFVVLILPTREYVVARAIPNTEDLLQRVIVAEDRIVRYVMSEINSISDAVYDLTPVYISRFAEGVFHQNPSAPLDGHPSSLGASILAETVDSIIFRWASRP